MGRTPKGRITVQMEEVKISADGLILPSHLIKSNVGLVVQSGIDLVPTGSRVALEENEAQEMLIDNEWYVSSREKGILMINQ